jgi:hypothetical protein
MPPGLTVKPLPIAVPNNSIVPALKTIVPLAVPPASMTCVPPKTGLKNDWAPETLAPLA